MARPNPRVLQPEDYINGDTFTGDWLTVKKKPIIIHAIQMTKPFTVHTLEGTVFGRAGDYLMIGAKGERYPCQKDIFEETYEVLANDRE